MPLTVKAVRSDEQTQRAQAVQDSQAALATADAALAAANAVAGNASQALAALQNQEAGLRSQLAAASMPADIDKLQLDLEANLLAQSPAAAAYAAAQDTVARKTRERQRLSAAAGVARDQLALANAALTAATGDDDQANGWRAALKGPVLAGVVATAKSAPVTTLVTAATNNLKTLLGGSDLFDLLRSRFDDAVTAAGERDQAAARAGAALNGAIASRTSVDGAVLAKGAAFYAARTAAQIVAEQSGQQLAWAQSTLQVATAAAPVTASEQDRITARAAIVVANPNAAARELAVRQARVTARGAAAKLEAKTLPKKALDPTYDPSTDNSVKTELADSTAADKDLADKTQAFLGADEARIDQWEVALPPPLSMFVYNALRALATVDLLANKTNLANLVTQLDTAESDYAKAIQDQDKAQALIDAATALWACRLDDAAAITPVAELRAAAAVRGAD